MGFSVTTECFDVTSVVEVHCKLMKQDVHINCSKYGWMRGRVSYELRALANCSSERSLHEN